MLWYMAVSANSGNPSHSVPLASVPPCSAQSLLRFRILFIALTMTLDIFTMLQHLCCFSQSEGDALYSLLWIIWRVPLWRVA